MPVSSGVFTRIWQFVNHRNAGDPITRADMDIALDDVAVGINQALSDASTVSALTTRVTAAESDIDDLEVLAAAASQFSAYTFDDLVAFTDDRTLTYDGADGGFEVTVGDYISLVNGGILQIAASGATGTHYQNDHQTLPVKALEAGHTFSTLARFKEAVARGETYYAGDTVHAAGIAYRFLDDGNTDITGLTGWAVSFLEAANNLSDVPDADAALANLGFTADAIAAAKMDADLLTSAGSSNAYTLTPGNAITAYSAGQKFTFKADRANTGAATLNVSGLGAKDLQKYDGAGSLAAFAANEIAAGRIYTVIYDGTRFVAVTPIVLDEDDMASDSPDLPPSQQAAKAYVDAQVAGATYAQYSDATGQTLDGTTTFTWIHGLGSTPETLSVWIECLVADKGFSVGDVVFIPASFEGNGSRGTTVWANSTEVGVAFSGYPYIATKTGGAVALITTNSWRIHVRAGL